MFQHVGEIVLDKLPGRSGSILGDAYQTPPSSPLNSIHLAAEDVRTALGAAQNLMGRLIGYPQVGAATKAEPSLEPPLLDLLGNVGMSISSQAREILACINAINAKLP